MRIAMIGGGYVGLVSSACFAEFGIDVTVVETDVRKLAALHEGHMPIYEPGLEKLVAENVTAGRLAFTDDLAAAVHDTEAVFIAVGTPTRRGDGHADLTYVYAAAEKVAHALTHYAVIITKSTVPVGTSRSIEEIVRTARPDLEFDVASNPEFLREGNAIGDFMRPDRVVIGTESERARDVLRQLYRSLYLIEAPIVFTDIETAELTEIRRQRLPGDEGHLHQRDGGPARASFTEQSRSCSEIQGRRPSVRTAHENGADFPEILLGGLIHVGTPARFHSRRGGGYASLVCRKSAPSVTPGVAMHRRAKVGSSRKPLSSPFRQHQPLHSEQAICATRAGKPVGSGSPGETECTHGFAVRSLA